MKSLLSITAASLILVIGLGACGISDKLPTSNSTVIGAQAVDPISRALNRDIAFDMEAKYSLGDPVEIAIRNDSNQIYYYQSEYPACFNLQFFDDSQESRPYPYADPKSKERVLSPGRFIVPGGTHCDLLFEQALKPGKSVVLFTWGQLMCTKDRWGCLENVPVEADEYVIRGEFSSRAKVIGFGAKRSTDQITTTTWGFTIQPP